ncbi:MAG TPA: adenylate/guanylate cyclase domain-containing protein [Candidatus Acidoferrum sp.]|nr:adenylate/guanylate cyclase domain-containing protein [Candidatus Acidoferrum sp.]
MQNLWAQLQRQLALFWSSIFRGTRVPFYLGVLATALVAWIHGTDDATVVQLRTRLDHVVYDLRFNLNLSHTSRKAEGVNIVIVNYDERSLKVEGQWPWSRFKIGDMVKKLSDDGALVIGFDVFFPEPERNARNELEQRIAAGVDASGEGKALLPQLKSAPDVLFDGDAYFADKMQSGAEVVLGLEFLKGKKEEEKVKKGVLPQPVFKIKDEDNDAIPLQEETGYTGNNEALQAGAAGAGFFNTLPDDDGVIRTTPLVLKFDDHIYPSLALEMARRYLLAKNFSPAFDEDSSGRTFVGINIEKTFVPTDSDGWVKVPYIGHRNAFRYISATDVLHDTLTKDERDELQNSLVLVGTDSTGLYDLRSTPMDAVYPGVEVHANVLNAIFGSHKTITIDSGNAKAAATADNALLGALSKARNSPFPTRPDWEWMVIMTAIFVIGFGLALVYPHLGPALLAISSVAFVVGLTVLNFYLWREYNLDLSLVELWLVVVLLAVINMAYGFMKEGMHRKVIKGMFDQYVPPAHIDAMLNDPDKYNFSGESKELSVLFSDIRNFTTISEKLKAAELKQMLNEFFTPITGIIFDNNGTIDKYVGDMVMAFWGAPLDDARHREHAVNAALNMLKKVEELKPLFKAQGLPEVNIGVGINSGMMNVGDMGSTYRRAYTVIGDAVNLGSRLEGITKSYGVKLLIGEQTYDGLKGFLCRQIDKVQVKGKDEPIRIYQPLCRESEAGAELKALVDEYHAAYQLYLAQQWDQAAAAFEQLKRKEPDTYLYALYLERIANLREQGLAPDWDGTYRFTTK